MFLCVFSFFLFLSSQKNSCIFRFTFFQNKDFAGKTSCFFVYRSLFLFRVFLSSVFHVVFCLIFLDLLRNMLPFQNVFFSSLFPPFVHPLSICSLFFVSSCFLVSFTFFVPLLTSFLGLFLVSFTFFLPL